MLNQFKYKSVRIVVRPKVISCSQRKALSQGEIIMEFLAIMELLELLREHRTLRIHKKMMTINQSSKMCLRKKSTYLNPQ